MHTKLLRASLNLFSIYETILNVERESLNQRLHTPEMSNLIIVTITYNIQQS